MPGLRQLIPFDDKPHYDDHGGWYITYTALNEHGDLELVSIRRTQRTDYKPVMTRTKIQEETV